MNFREFENIFYRLAEQGSLPEPGAETLQKFQKMEEIYRAWNEKINVISRKDIEEGFYEHHVLHSLAIAAYRRALARYPNDSYMPYLIIELSTLYKRMGDYDAALALFDEMLALPVVAKNAVVVQEFQRSRRALRVVFDMLAAQEPPALPFGEVPKELLAEADRLADGQ